jgi:uncharacterized protein YfbU (UPF0304 family)
MKLTRVERWILSNQFLILEKLDRDQAKHYSLLREVVENGYELNYDWVTEYIYGDSSTMSAEECNEVIDTLAMFDALQRSYQALSDKTGIDTTWLYFAGYDGNNESKFMGYAEFLVEKEGKFTDIPQDGRFNSHMPVRGRYRQMLDRWKQSSQSYSLSKESILRILEG